MDITKHIQNNALKVLIKPNSNRNRILGFSSDKKALKIAVKAVSEKGKANQELIRFLSKLLKKQIRITKGLKSREKILHIY